MKRLAICLLALAILLALTACSDNSGTARVSQTQTDAWIVTFNPRDRDQAVSQTEVKPGEKLEKPADPVRADYAFTGWYTDKRAAGELYDFDAPVTDDLFLYAGWTSTKVRVTFDPNYAGGDIVIANLDGGVNHQKSIVNPSGDGVACRAGFAGDDGDVFVREAVQEAGFSSVGLTDKRDNRQAFHAIYYNINA